jgi:Uma2 family endonuclease
MAVQILRRRFTVKEYYLMAKAGILGEDDRVELIDGEIVEMAPIGSRHAARVKRLIQLLSQRVGSSAIVSAQDPVRLSEHSEPQPDIALLRPRDDFYASAHPGPQDVLLIIEIADTSIDYDRQVKVPLYARAGIPEYWLVDLPGQRIEVYRDPAAGEYRQVRLVRQGERLVPEAFPSLELSADDILGAES